MLSRAIWASLLLFLAVAVPACANQNELIDNINRLYDGVMDQWAQEYQPPACAKTCHEVACSSVGIKYGKYCGVGHGGCQGQEPCDAVDSCCKQHDECVDQASWGVLSNRCHEDFIACLDQQMLSGTQGFSDTCPYSVVIPNMRSAIELAMLLGDSNGGIAEQLQQMNAQSEWTQQ